MNDIVIMLLSSRMKSCINSQKNERPLMQNYWYCNILMSDIQLLVQCEYFLMVHDFYIKRSDEIYLHMSFSILWNEIRIGILLIL